MKCNWIWSVTLPLTVQIAARMPGRGGRGRSDSLVVILHLKPNWSPQAPEDVQQALYDQLPLFLLGETPMNTHSGQLLVFWDLGYVKQRERLRQ